MSIEITIGQTEYFPFTGKIPYEGPDSPNHLAFKYYDESRLVGDKSMKEHLRFAVCYWHTFCWGGGDPFGSSTRQLPWSTNGDPLQAAKDKLDAAFEFFSKLGVPYYTFHDRDMAPEGDTIEASERNLKELIALAKEKQAASGIKLLWGTSNLFSHPRYMNGAATNPDFAVLAHAAAQVRATLEAAVELGGENYVFWGGREGYGTLFNTDMKREREHSAQFFRLARDYGRSIGFKGTFLIEPKPMEPMKHQYDHDAATTIQFLKEFDLQDDFKLNVEANHATLAGHTFAHDLQVASDAGLLGSMDANRGDAQNGWDTDQFPTNLYDTIEAMLIILENGGIPGGINFDAKIRRNSIDLEDLFIAHIGGMDAFARGLLIAHELREKSDLLKLKEDRYASYNTDAGARFEAGSLSFSDLRDLAVKQGEPQSISGKQELYENIINQYIR